MSVGGRRGGAIAAINITPMIDVLLVLLVIFMLVQHALIRQGNVVVPPPEADADARPDPDALVLEVRPGGGYAINRQPVPADRLADELRALFAERSRRVLHVRGDASLRYGDVVAAVDAGVQAGVDVVGLMPR